MRIVTLALAGLGVLALVVFVAVGGWRVLQLNAARVADRERPPDRLAVATRKCIDAHLEQGTPSRAWIVIDHACRAQAHGTETEAAECVLRPRDSISPDARFDAIESECAIEEWLKPGALAESPRGVPIR